MDDPLLVEVQSEDYWYEGYNMRTGARGIFPAYYATEVTKDPESYKGTDDAAVVGELTVNVLVKIPQMLSLVRLGTLIVPKTTPRPT